MQSDPGLSIGVALLMLGLSLAPADPPPINAAAYNFTTIAGASRTGSADGLGSEAQFADPTGVAADSLGNTFIVDNRSHTIRMITQAGVVSTIAGFPGVAGSADGTGAGARFTYPWGVAVDNSGNLYVTDHGNNTIRKIARNGTNWVTTTIAGQAGTAGRLDGIGTNATFSDVYGITVDDQGNLFVAQETITVIRKIAPLGTNWLVSTIAGGNCCYVDGIGTNAAFVLAFWLAANRAGEIFVADAYNSAIRRITLEGTNWVVKTIAGGSAGHQDGTGTNASFLSPGGIAVDSSTNLYVNDSGNYTVRGIMPTGTNWEVRTIAGRVGVSSAVDGIGTNASMLNPRGIAVTGPDNLRVADGPTIRNVTSAGVVATLAGVSDSAGSRDGIGKAARFYQPYGEVVDNAGNIYVADYLNSTIRKVTSAGLVSTVAGLATNAGSADGVGANARFSNPTSVALDAGGNLYVADSGNHMIRKISQAGVVTTIAGSTNAGSADGTGANASFRGPSGIAVDGSTNVFVSDSGNQTIRKITPVGANWEVKTIAGQAGITNEIDAIGTNACFKAPGQMSIDNVGDLYVVDNRIRKIARSGPDWVVTTIPAGIYSGAGMVAVDSAGDLYVESFFDFVIQKITHVGTNWTVSTIGGVAAHPGGVDGAGTAALFFRPGGLALDSARNIYVADSGNNTIRKGVFSQCTLTNPVQASPAPMSAQLVVNLLPPAANGQWRFPWEFGWRNSGQAATNLVAGEYTVELRNQPGWLAIPPIITPTVTNGGTTPLTLQYYPTIAEVDTNGAGGALTVNLGPSPPEGAGWRFLGDSTPYFPSGFSINLLPGTYLIEFAFVSGRVKPSNLSVQVFAGRPTIVSENYLLAHSPPSGVEVPVPVPLAGITNLNDYPFGFNGQLQSDVGFGSGVAVQPSVVLTAAHMVFDDQALTYARQVYWSAQREAGVFEPKPLLARGWYVLSGYAVQRTNDMLVYAPNVSTPQSRNLDVAAVYFESTVAGGGYGGYLPSDDMPNPWLTGTSLKMLVGYPVDGSAFNASVVPGRMYQTTPQPYPLSLAADPVPNQQVYVAPWLLGYPGNSGGPLYVQFNGYFYPAGVYSGLLYNGTQPYASAVRAIDSNVVSLITRAATLGDLGTNNPGGGVIVFIPDQNISLTNPAYVQVRLGPAELIGNGAGWRLHGDASYGTNVNGPYAYTRAVTTNGATIEFQPVHGWISPTNQTIALTPGSINVVSNAFYIPDPGTLVVLPPGNSTASGPAGGPFSPVEFNYTLTNSGGSNLIWAASQSTNWLTLSADSGLLAEGASTNLLLTLNANAGGLPAGLHTNTVSINTTQRLVILSVTPAPQLEVGPQGGLSSSGYEGGPFSSPGSFSLSNSGGGVLTWEIGNATNWLSLSAGSGTLAAHGSTNVTVSVNIDTAGFLSPGPYVNSLVFSNRAPGGLGSTNRTVTLNVLPTSQLVVLPDNGLSSGGYAAGPFTAVGSFMLSNSGVAGLSWAISNAASWLSLSIGAGNLAAQAETSVTVTVNGGAGSLTSGSYSNWLLFTNRSSGGAGSTNRPVLLTVRPIRLMDAKALNDGGVAMTLDGSTSRLYSIVTSTDALAPLTSWLVSLSNVSGQTRFTNPAPPALQRFFRARVP